MSLKGSVKSTPLKSHVMGQVAEQVIGTSDTARLEASKGARTANEAERTRTGGTGGGARGEKAGLGGANEKAEERRRERETRRSNVLRTNVELMMCSDDVTAKVMPVWEQEDQVLEWTKGEGTQERGRLWVGEVID